MPSSARAGSVKIILEGRADQLLSRIAGQCDHLLVDVGDDAQRIGGHQGVDVRFDQRPGIELRRLHLFGQANFVGDVLRNEQEADCSPRGVHARCDHDAGGELLAILALAAQGAFPLSISQCGIEEFAGFAAGYIVGGVQNGRVGFAHHLRGLISIQPSRALIPQQDFSFQILADDRVFGRGFQNIGDEIDRLLRVANNGVVEKLGFSHFLGKAHLLGNVFGDQQKANRLALRASPGCNNYPCTDAPCILTHSCDNAFPLAVPESSIHDFSWLSQSHVLGSVQNFGIKFSDNLIRIVAIHASGAFVPQQNLSIEIFADDGIFSR